MGNINYKVLAVVAVPVLLMPFALAMPQFRLAAIPQLHYDKDFPLWKYDKRAMSCTFCHMKESGGSPWNPFGEALKAQFKQNATAGKNNKFPQVLYELLKSSQDSDKDGYPDALEIFAHTLPGNPESFPSEPLESLQEKFNAAGGVQIYAPKK